MTSEFDFDVKHEDYAEWLSQIEQTSDDDCPILSEPDPYAKCVHSPEIQNSATTQMDADGNIHADNLSAYWIPQLTLQREIGGTIYTVTGYYEGKTDFVRKLERMTVDRMCRAMEDDTDDQYGMGIDMAGIKNWINEFYARNTSRKIRVVNKSKGARGIPLTVNVPYGYRKDPNNPTQWLVDEEAAIVVKYIFKMAMEGRGPSQIAPKSPA